MWGSSLRIQVLYVIPGSGVIVHMYTVEKRERGGNIIFPEILRLLGRKSRGEGDANFGDENPDLKIIRKGVRGEHEVVRNFIYPWIKENVVKLVTAVSVDPAVRDYMKESNLKQDCILSTIKKYLQPLYREVFISKTSE